MKQGLTITHNILLAFIPTSLPMHQGPHVHPCHGNWVPRLRAQTHTPMRQVAIREHKGLHAWYIKLAAVYWCIRAHVVIKKAMGKCWKPMIYTNWKIMRKWDILDNCAKRPKGITHQTANDG